MAKKEALWPKLIFPVFLIIGFSLIYIFGPAYTGFYALGNSGISSKFYLVIGLIIGLVALFVVLEELIFKLR